MIRLFDANCAVGQRMSPSPGELYRPVELIEELDRVGIKEALVYHMFAKEGSPAVGNKRLMEEIIPLFPQLHPCWVLLPDGTGEMESVEAIIGRMAETRVRVARMFPVFHAFQLNQRVCGSVLSALEDKRIPLIVDYDGQIGADFMRWDELAQVLEHYSNLPLILAEPTYSCQRNLYPLLATYPNLTIDISLFCAHGGIEDLCVHFGAERLIFGTGMPIHAPGPALTMLLYANVSQAEKTLIGSENLHRLMKASME